MKGAQMGQGNGNKAGAGTWLVKTLNGMGLIAVFGAVAIAAMKWGDVDRLQEDVKTHCTQQEARWSDQKVLDTQQDKVVQMYNEALIRIETKQEAMKEQLGEIQMMIKGIDR